MNKKYYIRIAWDDEETLIATLNNEGTQWEVLSTHIGDVPSTLFSVITDGQTASKIRLTIPTLGMGLAPLT